jgi:KH/beta-lactamase-domain protein
LNDFLKEMKEKINEMLPAEVEITSVDIEGPEIVIYTKSIGTFLNDERLIKNLASQLKKRFVIRPDSSILMDPEQAMARIKEIIPTEAGVERINFDASFNEVVIEAKKLGLVIGHGGETLKKITIETGWLPRLLRTPTGTSNMMKGIRDTLIIESKDVKALLKQVGKRIYRSPSKPTEWIRITALGGCREVGRSCLLIETPESKVMLDCGLNVASTENSFPYFNSIDFGLDQLDAVVISHCHMDHSGFLPYLFQYGYKGPVYCTTPTRDLMALLQEDYLDVLAKNAKMPLYSEKNIKEVVKHCIPREYGEVTDITPDIRLTLHNAGHILGSSLIHLHIGEGAHNLLYTGDLKFGYTELFDPAETRFPRLETLLMESTYGGQGDTQAPRYVGEKQMIDIILETTQKNGIVLIPTFAVGRAQEVSLIIENYARQKGWDIPVYLDGKAKEASAIHTAYPEYLKKSLQRRVLHNDSPFDSNIFQMVDRTKRKQIIEQGRCVVLAPAGMMNGGSVMEYFKNTCEDPKNTLLFVGYQAEGSFGRKLQRGVKDVALEDNGKTRGYKVNMRVETIEGFSGHADINQLLGYFKKLSPRPERALLLHGEEKKCMNLARTLSYKFKVEGSAPRNLDSIRLK